jgi:hypothetical protein
MDQEYWRPVEGYESLYLVSVAGEIWSERRGRQLRPYADTAGYRVIRLCSEHGQKQHRIHRIVASAFLANPGQLPEVNHKNGDRSDNCVENLEWVSKSDNLRHAYSSLGAQKGGQRIPPETRAAVKAATGSHTAVAQQFGVSRSSVIRLKA